MSWSDGIGIDSNDNIFIADGNNQRVLKCNISSVCSIFAGETGVGGSDSTHFNYADDVAIDSTGNVYISDSDNYRVQKFNSAGVYQSTIGATGVPYLIDETHLNTPWGVALAADGGFYVTEKSGYRLIKLDANGAQQWTVGEAGVAGSDNAHFGGWWAGLEGSPAVDANGRVYVGDTFNSRVQIFNSNGSYYATLGIGYGQGNYEFNCPADVSIHPTNGDIYVTDHCNHRVQVYTSVLTYKGTIGATNASGSDNLHFNYPYGVTVDASGNIFVADHDNQRIQKCILLTVAPGFSCNTFAGETGISGNDHGHLGGPVAVEVDGAGRVYVADEWNSRIQVFDASGAYLTTISGSWGISNGDLINPSGLVLDGRGNVYVTDRDNHRIQKFAIGTPNWVQTNLNGFGDPANRISSLGSFGTQLYAGTYNLSGSGSQLWHSTDGKNWSNVMSNGFGDATNVGIDHLIEFNGNLYAGTWNSTGTGTNGGQIWRSSNGTTWEQVANNGFGDSTNNEVMRLAVFNNKIYASTWSSGTHGTEIWSSGTGNLGDWTKVVDNGLGDATNISVVTMETFNGYLYAGTYGWDNINNHPDGCEVWRTVNGVDWTKVVTDGFGDLNCYNLSSLTAFNGSLYAGTGTWNPITQTSSGGQVWRCTTASLCDAVSDWTQVTANGFGNPQNEDIASLLEYDTRLYAVTRNFATGLEVWYTNNGTTWQQAGFGGFGDSNNSAPFYDSSVAVFKNSLFIGTRNWANGGEIWNAISGGDTTGVFRPSNGLLYLKNANTTGFADVAINYGTAGDYPIAGDWDGNGTATIGIYRNGSFYLRNSNTLGFADLVFAFGTPGDQPIAGDWDGDGVDTIGVFSPSTGQFQMRNTNTSGLADMSFYLGNVGDVGIAGDWNGDGMDTTGVFRPSNGIIFLKNANTTGFADVALNYGLSGDMPVTGDWDNDGIDTIGVYRNAQFFLRNSNTIGFADIVFGLGNPGDMPISGNWDGLP
jgi:hypothetical protein